MNIVDAVNTWPNLRRTAAAFVAALARSSGGVVTPIVIQNRMALMLPAETKHDIRKAASQARKAGAPVRTHYGVGYSLVMPIDHEG